VSLKTRAIDIWSSLIVNLIHAYDPERVIVVVGSWPARRNSFPSSSTWCWLARIRHGVGLPSSAVNWATLPRCSAANTQSREKRVKTSNYDKRPRVDIPGVSGCAWRGWGAIAVHLREEMSKLRAQGGRVLAIECYTGVFEEEIRLALHEAFGTAVWIDTRQAFLSSAEIDRLVAPDLGGDDPVFGYLSRLTLDRFLLGREACFDSLDHLRITRACRRRRPRCEPGRAAFRPAGLCGPAALGSAGPPATRRDLEPRVDNQGLKPSLQYKRSFFIDWRVCDRLKQSSMNRWDFLLDTCVPGDRSSSLGKRSAPPSNTASAGRSASCRFSIQGPGVGNG
jgi:hypothetical protein